MKSLVSSLAIGIVLSLLVQPTQSVVAQTLSLSGGADFGDVGRHLGNKSLGTLNLTTGPDATAWENGDSIRIAPNGFAFLPNDILIRNPTGTELIFDGSNQSHAVDVFSLANGTYDVQDYSLPADNGYTDGAGVAQQSYGGNWFSSGVYRRLDGTEKTFSLGHATLGGIYTNDRFELYNRTDSSRPVLPAEVTHRDNDPLKERLLFPWRPKDGSPVTTERQNPLLAVDTRVDGDGNFETPTILDLSGVSISGSGTSLQNRALIVDQLDGNGVEVYYPLPRERRTGYVDLGRQIVGVGTQTIQQDDTVTIATYGNDSAKTRVQLEAFSESSAGVDANLGNAVFFDDDSSTATVNLQANFSIDRSTIGTVEKQLSIGQYISSTENLTGESVQSNLNVGYIYGVVDNNSIIANNVTAFVAAGYSDTVELYNPSVGRRYSTDTHTAIRLRREFELGSDETQTVDLTEGNGVIGEGLDGETVASASYEVFRKTVQSSALTMDADDTEGASEHAFTITNSRTFGSDPIQAHAQLVMASDAGSTRWSLPELNGWNGQLGPGESIAIGPTFNSEGIEVAEGELGRTYRTSVSLGFRDLLLDADSEKVEGSTVALRVGGLFSFRASDVIAGAKEHQFDFIIEDGISQQAESGSLTLAAGTTLFDNGVSLQNTSENSSFEDSLTSVKVSDSQILPDDTEVTIGFVSLNDTSEETAPLRDAMGFDSLQSDIVQLEGLDSLQHTIEIAYNPDFEGQAQIMWFDEMGEGPEDDAWVNATLGNSNVEAYSLADGTIQVGGEVSSLDEYLFERLIPTSYFDYLIASPDGAVLGDYGFDAQTNTAWAVIDHNSFFSVAAVPEPNSFALILISGLIAQNRRRRS